jgi:hypothetical protein
MQVPDAENAPTEVAVSYYGHSIHWLLPFDHLQMPDQQVPTANTSLYLVKLSGLEPNKMALH